MLYKQLITGLIVGLIVGGLIGFVASRPKSNAQQQSATDTVTYQKFLEPELNSPFNFEVPTSWSRFWGGDVSGVDDLGATPSYAVADKAVALGDWNAGEVDFYFVQHNVTEKLIQEAKSMDLNNWTKEQVDGLTADVHTWPTENGQVNKGSTGGKDYYITLPETTPFNYRTVVIKKQAKGSPAYEATFDHMIKTMTLGKTAN